MTLDLTALPVTDTKVPEVTRATTVNPFLALVAELAANRDSAKSITVPEVDDLDKVIAAVVKKLRQAGKEHGVTVRAKVDGSTVTAWAVDRQYRPNAGRKPKAEVAGDAKKK